MWVALKELFLRNKTRIGTFLVLCYFGALVEPQVIDFLKAHLWLGTIVNIFNGALIASGMRIQSDAFHREKKIIQEAAKELSLPK